MLEQRFELPCVAVGRFCWKWFGGRCVELWRAVSGPGAASGPSAVSGRRAPALRRAKSIAMIHQHACMLDKSSSSTIKTLEISFS